MKISILVEGETEKAFKKHLSNYLKEKLAGKMPKLDFIPSNGRIPTCDKLKRIVSRLLSDRKSPSDCVIALTDVYTGKNDFKNAEDAKTKMRQWVGEEPKFYPHAAQYDFEAWLIPYWSSIQKLAGNNRNAPGGNPENINHNKPPSYHIREIFECSQSRRSYNKPRDAGRILNDNGLDEAVIQCSELKAFVNTIISVCGGTVIP
jgi:hypothetical protein